MVSWGSCSTTRLYRSGEISSKNLNEIRQS